MKELERRLRVSDMVIKFLTVRIDEKLKRIGKAKEGARKACRSQARSAAAAPAFSAAYLPGEPHAADPRCARAGYACRARTASRSSGRACRRARRHRPAEGALPSKRKANRRIIIWQNKEVAAR